MEIIKAKRFIARNIIAGPWCGALRFVDLSGEMPVVEPFSRETEATIFIDGRVALIDRALFHAFEADVREHPVWESAQRYSAQSGALTSSVIAVKL